MIGIASIKSFAIKQRSKVKITTRFMPGKLVMFALKSFIFVISKTFCFPQENVIEIYKKYIIETVEIFHVLTDTDSTSLKFIFISDPNSELLPEETFWDIIFKVIIASGIYKRFESCHVFWHIFGAREENK